jgi:rhodanese-related sulfurtransferase
MNPKHFALCIVAGALCAGAALAADPVAVAPVSTPVAPAQSPLPLISQDTLLARQAEHDPALFVLDVRTPEEFGQGHVPGAVNIPYDQVAARLADVPKDKDVVLYCRSGRRTALAAEVLAANGYARLSHLDGDMNAWIEKARPIQALASPPDTPQP